MTEMLRVLVVLTLLLTPAAAHAQAASSEQEIAAEARYILLDGPEPGEKRGVSVWRPPNAPARPLPVLYMADGVVGLNVVTPRLRPAILSGAMAPVLVIAIASSPQHRRDEYVPRATSPRFETHQRWFFETVMPWAERVAGASSDPAQRAIGGFSNGADFALATAARRPEMFGAVLAYSPVLTRTPLGLDARAARIRWVLTGGRGEFNGDVVRLVNTVAAEVSAQGGTVRRCTGPWRHAQADWRDLSPASIAWLFAMPEADAVASPAERGFCRLVGPH